MEALPKRIIKVCREGTAGRTRGERKRNAQAEENGGVFAHSRLSRHLPVSPSFRTPPRRRSG